MAAEAIEVSVSGVDREGAGFFLVKGAEAGVVLGSGLAQADVVANDADDVGLLLDGLSEIIGHSGRPGNPVEDKCILSVQGMATEAEPTLRCLSCLYFEVGVRAETDQDIQC